MRSKYLNLFIVSCLLISPFMVNAEIKQKYKCYISLVGGSETIYFAVLQPQSLAQVASGVLGRSILTTLSPNKMTVYKVYECTTIDKKFKSAVANNIESNLEL